MPDCRQISIHRAVSKIGAFCRVRFPSFDILHFSICNFHSSSGVVALQQAKLVRIGSSRRVGQLRGSVREVQPVLRPEGCERAPTSGHASACSNCNSPNVRGVQTVNGLPVYVHRNGFAKAVLKYSMKASSFAPRLSREEKSPRLRRRLLRMLNQIST